jgi:hypothetical protein
MVIKAKKPSQPKELNRHVLHIPPNLKIEIVFGFLKRGPF